MKKKDIVVSLREPYTPEKGYGICKIKNSGYENIWFVVSPPPPKEINVKLLNKIIRQAYTVSNEKLSSVNNLSFNQAFNSFLERREVISSSQIDQDISTNAKIVIHEKIYHEQDTKIDNKIIYGYSLALKYGVSAVSKKGIQAINASLVRELHEMMMKEDPFLSQIGGLIRQDTSKDIVQIGGKNIKDSIYNPAPPEYVMKCLVELFESLDNWNMRNYDLQAFCAVWHAHFEAIHPFMSGNGRIGRILLQLQLMAATNKPIYLSAYIKKYKEDYFKALESAQKKRNYIPIIRFICHGIIASYQDELIVKTTVEDLFNEWLLRGKLRKNSSAANALHILISSPVITIKLLSEKLGVSFQAASVAINRLEKARIVKKSLGSKRSRVFIAEEINYLSLRNFGELPSSSLKEAREILGV